ncbi:hypothetical protein ACQ4T2_25680, partial [Escherichia coli]|uniref:hypothetical protein n=1 Tax=Escherichia coli TaxID=562 RepID=UPI003D310B57
SGEHHRNTMVMRWGGGKKVFLGLTVHTVHLLIFLFNIIMIDGDQLVKSEQSTLHLSASLACFRRTSPQYDGDEVGGG